MSRGSGECWVRKAGGWKGMQERGVRGEVDDECGDGDGDGDGGTEG